MVAAVEAVTGDVVMVKGALRDPAGTVMVDGTTADGLLLDSNTLAPPAGALLFNVTVPMLELLPVTLTGLTVTDDSAASELTVTIAVP